MTPMVSLSAASPVDVGQEQRILAEALVEVVEVVGEGQRGQAHVQLQNEQVSQRFRRGRGAVLGLDKQEQQHQEDYVRWSVPSGDDPNVGVTQSALLGEDGPPRQSRTRRPHHSVDGLRGEREHHIGGGPHVLIHSWCHGTHSTGLKEYVSSHESRPP
jgi:hypothetical protein